MAYEKRGIGVNLGLLIWALAGTAFGCYGLFFAESGPDASAASLTARGEGDASHRVLDYERDRNRPGRDPGSPADRSDASSSDAHARGDSQPTSNASGGGNPAAESPNTPPNRPAEPEAQFNWERQGDGVIDGIVLDQASTPVAGADVTLVVSNQIGGGGEIRFISGGFDDDEGRDPAEGIKKAREQAEALRTGTQCVKSGNDGAFRLTGLDPTRAYTLSAKTGDHSPSSKSGIAPGSRVILVLGEALPKVNGRVILPDGTAVKRFTVIVVNQGYWENSRRFFESADGTFSMSVAKGTVKLRAAAEGLLSIAEAEADTNDGPVKDITLVIEPAAAIEVVAMFTNKQPLVGAQVSLRYMGEIRGPIGTTNIGRDGEINWQTGQWSSSSSRSTDSLGRCRCDGLPPGDYQITVSSGSTLRKEISCALKDGVQREEVVFEAMGIVRVTLKRDTGTPVSGANFSATRIDGDEGVSINARELPETPGVYMIAGLEPGQYRLTATANNLPATRAEINTGSGETALEMRFEKSAFIVGVLANTKVPCYMILTEWTQDDAPASSHNTSAYVEENGRFRLGPLAPGRGNLKVTLGGGEVLTTVPLTLSPGDNPVEVPFTSPASLIVRCACAEGVKIQNATLITPWGGQLNPKVSPDGEIDVPVLSPGTYTLAVYARYGGNWGSYNVEEKLTIVAGTNEHSLTAGKPNAVVLNRMYDSSPLEEAGLAKGDIVRCLGGQRVRSVNDLAKFAKQAQDKEDNQKVMLDILRAGATISVEVPPRAITNARWYFANTYRADLAGQ